jgi:hypothetical protein
VTVKIYLARGHGCKSHHGAAQGGFTAAGFTYQSEDITAVQLKTETIHSLNRYVVLHKKAFTDGEVHVQIFYPQQRFIAVF